MKCMYENKKLVFYINGFTKKFITQVCINKFKKYYVLFISYTLDNIKLTFFNFLITLFMLITV